MLIIQKIGISLNQSSPIKFSMFHSTSISFAKWKSKWDYTKGSGNHQPPSKTYTRYAVRQKRTDAKRALKYFLLYGKPSKYVQDGNLSWCGEEIPSKRKENSNSNPKNSKRSKGNHSGSKFWQNKKGFYDEDYEHSEPIFSTTFGGRKCYTWNFGTWETYDFHSSTSEFEWGNNFKRENEKKRFQSESDKEDDTVNVGSCTHRVALGLPPTGPLKLDDVKYAFRASALKWHPDKHQGPTQVIAGEKFKLCVDAYNSLCNAIKST